MSFHQPGIAAVQDGEEAYHINFSGNQIYAKRFIKTFGFYNGLAAVQDKTGYYHINIEGMEKYPERYSWVGNFQEDMCVVRSFDGRYYHILKDGKPAYAERYRYVGDYKYGIASVYRSDGLSTHIDVNGKYVHDQWYLECDVYHKGYAVVRDDEGYFHIDINGKSLYEERYEWAEPFYNGHALVSDYDGRLFTIDETGAISNSVIGDLSNKVRQRSRNELMNKLVGYWDTQIIYSIVRYDILQKIKDGCNDRISLQKSCDIPYTSLNMIVRVALLWGLIRETNDKYHLTYKGELLTENGSESLKYASLMWGEEHYLAMSKLVESLKDNRPYFKDLFGSEFFDYISRDREKSLIYNRAMAEYSIDYDSLINLYDFTNTKILIDIGGSHGQLISKILKKHTKIEKGIVLDLPEVIKEAIQNLKESPNYNKIEFVPGNFFEHLNVPYADTIILSRVIHDWNDSVATNILKNVSNCLKDNGILLIFDMVVPETPKIDMGTTLNFDLLVMVGGRERTKQEFNSILNDAGFKINNIKKSGSIISMIIAEKLN
jgi:SAM-dependent methyltransferase/predicted transcriptional regulator